MIEIPKDRQIIIEHEMGTNVAIWSGADEKFVYANTVIDMYEGKWDMYYFENEYIDEKNIKNWKEM